ncbi:hypothetical protein DAEQUDRAFT_714832 [Daedalea quercina L-15889]|uniref:PIPK domain-containing protein n=1 Tax=Daedalea quercina L-15889 TaxID=1314783 RepID=A0A165N3S4_9APHY|nr:hypothetical protein DAEQUDRAFT_714832 [Daedalea quercina L-15889]
MNQAEKPLPAVPQRGTQLSSTLTTEARAHLQRFILQALEEENVATDRENWADTLRNALLQIGGNVSRGGWLAGFKRMRQKTTERREEEEARHRREKLECEKAKEQEDRSFKPNTLPRTPKSKGEQGEENKRPSSEHGSSQHLSDSRSVALQQLRQMAATHTSLPLPKPSSKHLLLTVEAYGAPLKRASEDLEYDMIPYGVDCVFVADTYSLPDEVEECDCVLYGLAEWDASARLYDAADEDCVQIVGGVFKFKGVTSVQLYKSLVKVLRLSTFLYLSLLLEQCLLSNSHVELHFPQSTLPTVSTLPEAGSLMTKQEKARPKRESTLAVAGGIWSFFSKKTENLVHRVAAVSPSIARRGSFELPMSRSLSNGGSMEGESSRPRRFSLISTSSSGHRNNPDVPRQQPFLDTLRNLEAHKDLVSTSPGLVLPLPSVLVSLAEKEKQDSLRRLNGEEKAALTSLLGWEGKDALGRGMIGTSGFVRQQGISLLYSAHVPFPLVASTQPPTPPSSAPTASVITVPHRPTSCGNRRKWTTYRFYQHGHKPDETLGETITRLCTTAEEPCTEPDCHFVRGDHDQRWIHNGVRIVATVGLPSSVDDRHMGEDTISMWQSCMVCGEDTSKEQMHDGTYLFSFGKYLELLIYSPALCGVTPRLCEHTAAPTHSEATSLPETRFHILRKFSCRSRTVTFSLSTVEDIFELKVPRLQIIRRRQLEKGKDTASASSSPVKVTSNIEDRRILRKEIMRWWQGLSERMDQLEENFVRKADTTRVKALPRLPSEDDAYDSLVEASQATPKASLSRLPSSSSTPTVTMAREENNASTGNTTSSKTITLSDLSTPSVSSDSVISSKAASVRSGGDEMQLLTGLRHSFQRQEQDLYVELSRTPTASLNNVRRSFIAAAKGASRRLSAWEAKHSSSIAKDMRKKLGRPSMVEPEWWQSGCHAIPGGNVIVKEDDWGSIIAFTLSSADYQRELAAMSTPTPRAAVPTAPPSTPLETRSSFFTPGSSLKRFLTSTTSLPDPDQDDVGWNEPETYSAVITRKEHPKDPTTLLSIRDVLRHKSGTDTSGSSSFRPSSSLGAKSPTDLAAARAKPAVELSIQAADGHVSGLSEDAGKLLHELEANASVIQTWRSSGSSNSSASGFVETNIRRGKSASIISTDSDASSTSTESGGLRRRLTPPPLPPKDAMLSVEPPARLGSQGETLPPAATPSTFIPSIANTLTSAMKFVLSPGETLRSVPTAPHHGLLSTDSPVIDDRPHIKYDWTIGKRLKFSCTVYYARQFDSLRRRCGIEDVFLKSLMRSANWAAEGGKSKSNFWKTSDDQFIIKTLVNAWNVADLQVLIDLGPSYFRYMDSTATRPSVLAKLLGFYTIEIRNLENGATQARADLLVMENLFYGQKISKTFDLKGIQGRKVKASNAASKTLFDGEWIEDQRRALTLVRPYSKVLFQEAVKADCDFLAGSNIMDYSLLLGVDEESKRISCGLVDTIGSYTFAKTLEYKAKHNLNAGKEVTVVPPHEYQDRFVNAMDEYFLACPDKWSRPLDDTHVPHSHLDLPSVL